MSKYETPEFLNRIKVAISNSKSMAEACASVGIHFNTFKRIAVKHGLYIPNQRGIGISKRKTKGVIPLIEILNGVHPSYQTFKLKNRLIEVGIKENKCEICGTYEWLGKPIHCELDHINGNNKDHKQNNLRMLCPMCHSQTATFRAKNIK